MTKYKYILDIYFTDKTHEEYEVFSENSIRFEQAFCAGKNNITIATCDDMYVGIKLDLVKYYTCRGIKKKIIINNIPV